jgi:hypothetical protein
MYGAPFLGKTVLSSMLDCLLCEIVLFVSPLFETTKSLMILSSMRGCPLCDCLLCEIVLFVSPFFEATKSLVRLSSMRGCPLCDCLICETVLYVTALYVRLSSTYIVLYYHAPRIRRKCTNKIRAMWSDQFVAHFSATQSWLYYWSVVEKPATGRGGGGRAAELVQNNAYM